MGGGVGAEGPGGVDVADDECRVGQVLHHDGLPDELLVDREWGPVDGQFGAARQADLEARGGDDDVRVEFLARGQLDARRRDLVDNARDDAGLAGAEARIEVAVGAEAHALLERVVARLEVRVVLDGRRELLDGSGAEHAFGQRGEVVAEVDDEEGHDEPFDAD